ncbi:hypothetical protein ACFPPD_03645 [Cohnella suwonensis]|uniref:Uncharacterized protein n=1 Tax=Cohnella suwonensis TaxID=696072 RepID=A0ABW0LT75_9BACL
MAHEEDASSIGAASFERKHSEYHTDESAGDAEHAGYSSAFRKWSGRAERRIARAILVLAALLVVSQLLLQFPSVRRLVTSADRAEGIPFRQSTR